MANSQCIYIDTCPVQCVHHIFVSTEKTHMPDTYCCCTQNLSHKPLNNHLTAKDKPQGHINGTVKLTPMISLKTEWDFDITCLATQNNTNMTTVVANRRVGQ